MSATASKNKGRGKEAVRTVLTIEEREAAEKQKRSFERSLAGPSVGKAGESGEMIMTMYIQLIGFW